MSRIRVLDTEKDKVLKMTEGNLESFSTLMEIIEGYNKIDPQAIMGGFFAVEILDICEIYGDKISILFKDKCNCNISFLAILLRATQLEFLSISKLKEIASDRTREITLTVKEWQKLEEEVCSRLVNFKRLGKKFP